MAYDNLKGSEAKLWNPHLRQHRLDAFEGNAFEAEKCEAKSVPIALSHILLSMIPRLAGFILARKQGIAPAAFLRARDWIESEPCGRRGCCWR